MNQVTELFAQLANYIVTIRIFGIQNAQFLQIFHLIRHFTGRENNRLQRNAYDFYWLKSKFQE